METRAAPRYRPSWEWLVALALLGVGYALLPTRFRLGPWWLFPMLPVVLGLGVLAAKWRELHRLARLLGLGAALMATLLVVSSVVFLVTRLPHGSVSATTLLVSAGVIWLGNVFAFALWYWEIDQGGPMRRHHEGYRGQDFLFPQVTLDAGSGWMPGFVDYFFLAFNTSTAFSPTDTAVLSRRAKLLTMTQASISIVIITVLAARAVNTLA